MLGHAAREEVDRVEHMSRAFERTSNLLFLTSLRLALKCLDVVTFIW